MADPLATHPGPPQLSGEDPVYFVKEGPGLHRLPERLGETFGGVQCLPERLGESFGGVQCLPEGLSSPRAEI